MTNKMSHANHIPIRTCVVCKARFEQKGMLSFVMMPSGIVFDMRRVLQTRKHYVCYNTQCVSGIEIWNKKRNKRKVKK